MSQEKPFYVYVHRRATDGEVFYVGKGHGKRAQSRDRNRYWHNIVNKHGFTYHIMMRFNSEECAFSFERALVNYYGRENLCNLTDGGGGVTGYRHTKSAKEKISIAGTGRITSIETREKLSKRRIGMVFSDETRRKISEAQTGEKNKNYGKKFSDDHRRKISDAHVKIPVECSNGMVFNSQQDAVRWLRSVGIHKACNSPISECIRNMRKSAYGYKWSSIGDKIGK